MDGCEIDYLPETHGNIFAETFARNTRRRTESGHQQNDEATREGEEEREELCDADVEQVEGQFRRN